MAPDTPHSTPQAGSAILLTGFDPFGGGANNPSWLIAQALHGQRIAGHQVVAAQLPTVFGQSLQRLQSLLQEHQPAITLCLGLAGGRAALSIERIGININDARIPDNCGAQPIDTPVQAGGPAAYFANLPIKAMLRGVQRAGVPCEVSQTAGTFVCNHVLYGLMHLLAQGAAPGSAWRLCACALAQRPGRAPPAPARHGAWHPCGPLGRSAGPAGHRAAGRGHALMNYRARPN